MKLPLSQARSEFFVLPQEDFLFNGTIKSNIDPFDHFTDDEIWMALEKVGLSEKVGNFPNNLQSIITEDGGNLSTGEKRLLALSAIFLNSPKVLILDEPTAYLDIQTDSLIQQVINKHFSHSTLITIIHRTKSLIDYDYIINLDDGEIKNCYNPPKSR